MSETYLNDIKSEIDTFDMTLDDSEITEIVDDINTTKSICIFKVAMDAFKNIEKRINRLFSIKDDNLNSEAIINNLFQNVGGKRKKKFNRNKKTNNKRNKKTKRKRRNGTKKGKRK